LSFSYIRILFVRDFCLLHTFSGPDVLLHTSQEAKTQEKEANFPAETDKNLEFILGCLIAAFRGSAV
jgi:hypothetical protein